MVKLVATTAPNIEVDGKLLTPEEFIVYVARVSNPNNQLNMESAPRLLEYLIKHKHWSPFEHANMTVEIVTSRGIAAQILRHRSFVFQEFSQRYAAAFNNIEYPARLQDAKNRQNSIEDLDGKHESWFKAAQQKVWSESFDLYIKALDRGIAKEQARFLLPLSTETKLYMTGSLRSWIHYVEIRAAVETQKEHRDIAIGVKKIMAENFPSVATALDWVV
jgi:thymidylate synthase (FAD)